MYAEDMYAIRCFSNTVVILYCAAGRLLLSSLYFLTQVFCSCFSEMAEKYTANPKKLIDQIEREARQRLEPLIEQAQV